MTVRNKSLSEMMNNLVTLMQEVLPDYLNQDNTKQNLAPSAALSLIECNKNYCVITYIGDEEYTECVDRTVPAVKRNFSIFIGSHDNTEMITMYDILTGAVSDGVANLESKGNKYFQNLTIHKGENPFIYYETDLCELVFRISVVN